MNMITDYHNYDNGYIGLVNLEFENLPENIVVNEFKLLRKSEFHVTIICAKKIAEIIDPKQIRELEAELVEFFKDFIKTNPMDLFEPTGEFRLVVNNERELERVTIVGMVKLPGIEELFLKLEEKYNTKLPLQPTHITLYTLQPEAGIGILSYEQLESESKKIEVPFELHEVVS